MPLPTPYYDRDRVTLYCGDAGDIVPHLEPVDLIVTDPPYYKVKGEWWDRQWGKPAEFLAWIGRLCDEWQRVLKPNGSLYVFASPQMAWGVEGELRKRFDVLTSGRWVKEAGWHQKAEKEALRQWLQPWEAVIFAQHPCASVEWENRSDGVRTTAFESIRQYLAGERDRAGWTTRQVAEAFQKKTGSRTVTGMAGHWFEKVQWSLPTKENYDWLRSLFNPSPNGDGPQHLRREYEDLRRPFNATPERPYTDVWDFPTVQDYPGKHPCEKPLAMMEHIIETSSREGATVLDCFMGSGNTLRAARNYGRRAIGIDIGKKWCRVAKQHFTQQVLPFGDDE